ncbi:MAG: magnesium/cobalt transporter CorA [Candidatus Eisenbacteria bacterium]
MAFHKDHPLPGSRPGTLVIPEGSPPPKIHLVRYAADRVESVPVAHPDEIPAMLRSDEVTWVDVQGFGDEEVLRTLARIFGLSPLALEDAVNAPQRAKSEPYDGYQLVISRVPQLDDEGVIRTPQVCFVIGPRFLLTFQKDRLGLFEPVRERLRSGIGPIRESGPDYLAYALIDTMVDLYYPIVESLSQKLDDLEDDVLDEMSPGSLGEIHQLRRQLVILRRIGWPQREMVSALVRERSPFLSDTVRNYLRDTQDHMAQIAELIDSTRDLATGLSDVFVSNLGHRTNEIMKVLTLMASIFIPLTFLAGIYGMNFEYMPELRERWGYFLVLGVMVLVALGMVLYFRRRGWMGSPPGGRKPRRRPGS